MKLDLNLQIKNREIPTTITKSYSDGEDVVIFNFI